ncbi:TIGR02301 family protein [Xanthobacter sp. V0B-10]|uniref:TIGR02301 family protein n=2 Tax=Xanthobacter albus TaxID=3119929 RepID=UPI00372AEE24
MRIRRHLPILALAGLLAAPLAPAPLGAMGSAAAAPMAEGAAPPYDDDLLRLAEILGGLHYLRPLCGATAEAQRWRDEMAVLIETEQPSEARKGKMIASFNRGYSSFAQVYRGCTPAARSAVERQLEEGARLAHEIVVRYGGN